MLNRRTQYTAAARNAIRQIHEYQCLATFVPSSAALKSRLRLLPYSTDCVPTTAEKST